MEATKEPSRYDRSGFLNLITFGFVSPLLTKGLKEGIQEDDAADYLPAAIKSRTLAVSFDQLYNARAAALRARGIVGTGDALWFAILRMFKRDYINMIFWMNVEMGIRLVAPYILRQFVRFIEGRGSRRNDEWWGWVLATLLALTGYGMMVAHHQLFLRGMVTGFKMRIQVMAAVHAKVLRMTRTSVQAISTGHVVNLISNDVRRFDDASPFWPFLIFGPIELALVLMMVALELGIVPAIVGVTTVMLIIPGQGFLVRFMGDLRERTAKKTDERVRLVNELINGSLAMKMYGWEEPMAAQLKQIRAAEAAALRKRSLINAANFALNFTVLPLCAFVTFAVAKGMGRTLNIASVFYVVSLLVLPRLWMGTFFTRAVESLTELRVSVRRLDRFLSQPEQGDLENGSKRGGDTDSDLPAVVLKGDFDWAAQPEGFLAPTTAGAAASKKPLPTPSGPAPGLGLGHDEPPRRATLRNIDLTVHRGELVAIVGAVGAGKSSLLSALLKEILPVTRQEAGASAVSVCGSIAYSAQVPWIQSGTVETNITFGLPREDALYAKVIAACALADDLAGLPAGDQTELGERGVNLSGGQRARVSLARAAYSRAAVHLLDDPLSAVDARVGRTLFHECIRGIMAGKTRLLVTHQRQFLPDVDRIFVMRDGEIALSGSYDELCAMGVQEVMPIDEDEEAKKLGGAKSLPSAKDLRKQYRSLTMDDLGDLDEDEVSGRPDEMNDPDASTDALGDLPSNGPGSAPGHLPRSKTARLRTALSTILRTGRTLLGDAGRGGSNDSSRENSRNLAKSARGARFNRSASMYLHANAGAGKGSGGDALEDKETAAAAAAGALTTKEAKASGGISGAVYAEHIRKIGVPAFIAIMTALTLGQACEMTHSVWLARWARSSPAHQNEHIWLLVYGLLTVGVVILATARSIAFFDRTLAAATRIHNEMTFRVLRAPLSFFHTTPAGRILNRFSKDQSYLDEMLSMTYFDALSCGGVVLGSIVYASISVPFIVPVLAPLTVLFIIVRNRYVVTSREVKRFEAVTRSPVYADFSSTLIGLPTIRAYRAGHRFRTDFLDAMDKNSDWWWLFICTSRWVGFRLDAISGLLLNAFTFLIMAIRHNINVGLMALALSQVLQLSGLMQWMVRQTAELENMMTSTERLLEYTKLPSDHPRVKDGAPAPPANWTRTGKVEFKDVVARYRPGLPPVLNGVSFTVEPGMSCGIVGRTGCGKSTTLLTLFRLIDVSEGTILLDGVDTASIGVDALRRQLAIIPQDPVLFSGTIRSNLDPWNAHPDSRLWEVLETTQLKGAVQAAGGLEAQMSEGGNSFSVGQRQLLCLTRALLADAHTVCLDEATANIDGNTDMLIQRALRDLVQGGPQDKRSGRTLLVIAHRLDTILSCDRIVVLSKGRVVEFGAPADLINRPGGAFAKMLNAAKVSGVLKETE